MLKHFGALLDPATMDQTATTLLGQFRSGDLSIHEFFRLAGALSDHQLKLLSDLLRERNPEKTSQTAAIQN
jgi:hypothetical protein